MTRPQMTTGRLTRALADLALARTRAGCWRTCSP